MDVEDLFAALDVGVRHRHLAVETARAQQRRVEHVLAVGGGDDDDAFVRFEPVHLHQELVQGLLAFVVAAAVTGAAMPADRVDLVDEDDAGRVLLGLFEHVADPARPHTDEHLDEVGARNGEEGHPGLAGDGACEQRLAGARRADQQRAFRDLAAEARKLLRVAQKLDDLLELFLGLVDAGDVVEGHPALALGEQLGPRFAEAHRPAFAAALHPVHHEEPQAHKHQHRQQHGQDRAERRLLLLLGPNGDVVGDQYVGDRRVTRHHRRIALPVGADVADVLAVDHRLFHLAAFDGGDELGVVHALRRDPGLVVRKQVEQGQDQQEKHDPEGEVSRVAQECLLRKSLARPPERAFPLK